MNQLRARLVQAFFIFWTGLIFLRLIYWQVIQSPQLKIQAQQQHANTITLPAARGQILAQDGFPLVTNTDNYLLYINPQKLPSDISDLLAAISQLPDAGASASILQDSVSSPLHYLPISHQVPPQVKQSLTSLNLLGIGFEPEPIRFYPEGSPSAYITGFVGKDSQGQPTGYFGLEGFYNRQLSGLAGKILEEKDAFGLPIVIGGLNRIPPRPGSDLTTSIDRSIQFFAFRGLAAGLEKYQAESGTVTILESTTGRILALVSLPGYDPGDYASYPPSTYKNPIISDAYEPGSTFKTLVMAAALDAGAVNLDTICDCSGPIVIADEVVRNWDNKYSPQSTLFDIILHSDNVGMVFVSRLLKQDRLLGYLHRFGIGQLTGVDMQEESTPQLRPAAQWHNIDLATAAFGQGIAVTPLQMTAAVNALANLGQFIAPRLVTTITSAGHTESLPPPSPSQVVSPQAASKVTQMMVNAVKNGPVRLYNPEGFLVAGKTGTAQIPIAGHYDTDKVIASFVGFAPADRPRFTMLVTLKNPQTSPWGSTTAAPIWFSIAKDIFRYYQILPGLQL